MKTREETNERLIEAQKLPVASLENVRNIPTDISKDQLKTYLEDFVEPTGSCWNCKKTLIVEWGFAHGISHCTTCGMGVKEYHYLKDEDGNEHRFTGSLQYHPKLYRIPEEDE